MAITTRDQLIDALGNNSSRLVLDKVSTANTVAGQFFSLWRAAGQPGQGAIPTAAARCTNATVGGFNFAQQTAPATTYGTYFNAVCSTSSTSLEIHDRLMHQGGMSGAVTTAQTVGLDMHANIGSDNLANRIGDPNYSDVQWWMEWYADTGTTASNATVTVTYNDGSSSALSVVALSTNVRRASLMVALNGLVPPVHSGKFIRSIDTVQLSATTGTAGNFGFTCTRPRMVAPLPVANKQEIFDWAALGLPEIYNASCLQCILIASTTSTGTVRGGGKLSHG